MLHGLYRIVSDRRAGGGTLKVLRDVCFRRGGPDELRKYGGQAVYGTYKGGDDWGALLDKLLDEGLVDEVPDGSRKTRLVLNHGSGLGSAARATLHSWGLSDAAIRWLTV